MDRNVDVSGRPVHSGFMLDVCGSWLFFSNSYMVSYIYSDQYSTELNLIRSDVVAQ